MTSGGAREEQAGGKLGGSIENVKERSKRREEGEGNIRFGTGIRRSSRCTLVDFACARLRLQAASCNPQPCTRQAPINDCRSSPTLFESLAPAHNDNGQHRTTTNGQTRSGESGKKTPDQAPPGGYLSNAKQIPPAWTTEHRTPLVFSVSSMFASPWRYGGEGHGWLGDRRLSFL
jgi:hypothetical protein